MRRTILTTLAVALLLLQAAPAVGEHEPGHRKKPGDPDGADLVLTFESPGRARAEMEQRWEGQRAMEFLNSLDAYFGAGDGKLSPEDVGAIEQASYDDMTGSSLAWLTVDESAAAVENVTVALDLPAGPQGAAVRMRHDVNLTFTPAEGDAHRVSVTPFWPLNLTLRAPDGWVLAEGEDAPGAAVVEAFADQNETTSFVLRPAREGDNVPSGGASQPAGGVDAPGMGPRSVPAGGAALALTALAALALAARRRRR